MRTISTDNHIEQRGDVELNFGGGARWRPWDPPESDQADAFVELIGSLRGLQNLVTGARPPAGVARAAAALIDEAARAMAAHQVEELGQIAGRLASAPGRAQAFAPVLAYDSVEEFGVAGTVSFGRFYVGGGGAAHGGTLPLMFDEVLGRLAGVAGRPPSRTAYLHVNFRKVVPIGIGLSFTASVDKIDGRKLHMSAALRQGDELLADAESLFVMLRPGQP